MLLPKAEEAGIVVDKHVGLGIRLGCCCWQTLTAPAPGFYRDNSVLCHRLGEPRASVLKLSWMQPGFFPRYDDALNAELKTPGTALVLLLELCLVTATYFYSKLEFGLTKYFQALL